MTYSIHHTWIDMYIISYTLAQVRIPSTRSLEFTTLPLLLNLPRMRTYCGIKGIAHNVHLLRPVSSRGSSILLRSRLRLDQFLLCLLLLLLRRWWTHAVSVTARGAVLHGWGRIGVSVVRRGTGRCRRSCRRCGSCTTGGRLLLFSRVCGICWNGHLELPLVGGSNMKSLRLRFDESWGK